MRDKEASSCLTNIDRRVYNDKLNAALDVAIKSLEAWAGVKAEIKEIRDIEAKNFDTLTEYCDGRYDAAGESLRIIDKHLKEVGEG